MNSERMACLFVLQRAALEGVDCQELLRKVGLASDYVETASISQLTEAFPRLVSMAVQITGNAQFGFQMGQAMHPCLLGAGGLAATHAQTMARCLETLAQLSMPCTRCVEFSTRKRENDAVWTMRLDSSCDSIAIEHMSDAWAASIVAFGHLTVGQRFAASEVWLQRPDPAAAEDYENFFGCSATFETDRNRVVISNELLHTESRLSDPFLCEQLLFAASSLDSRPSDTILDAVYQAIRRGSFALANVARELGLNERTLQRRLSEKKATFQQCLDETRLEMADTYLRLPSLTIDDIAHRLGFSSDKAFRKAYRRWTNRAPRDEE